MHEERYVAPDVARRMMYNSLAFEFKFEGDNKLFPVRSLTYAEFGRNGNKTAIGKTRYGKVEVNIEYW